MRRFTVFALLVVVLIVAASIPPVAAQGDKPACNPAAVIQQAAAMKSTGDQAQDLAALATLQADISAASVACTGYVFKGTGAKVVGPITLTQGVYKIVATAHGSISVVDLAVEGGACKAGDSVEIIHEFAIDKDIQAEGLERISSASCRLLFQVKGDGDWTITFEPIK
jgi:hypothetical protein